MLPPLKSLLFRILKSKEIGRIDRTANADRIVSESKLLDNDGAYEHVAINPDKDIAVLQYTGGTTGTPKGAMLTHSNLTINVQQIELWTCDLLGKTESILGVLPLFHIFAMTTVLNFGIARGYSLTLLPRFDLDQTMSTIAKTRPSIFPRRADHLQCHSESPEDEKARYVVFKILHFRWSGAANRGQAGI